MLGSNRLRELRKSQGWSRRELADRLAPQPRNELLHERTIRRWEDGDTAIPDHRKAELADLFGVSIPFLMCWSDGNGVNGESEAA